MSDKSKVELAAEQLLLQCLVDTSALYGDTKIINNVREAAGMPSLAVTTHEATTNGYGDYRAYASENDGDSSDQFDGWLPLRLATNIRYYDYTLQELKLIRNVVRITCDTNEVAKNILHHYRNFIVGRGVQIDIYPEDLGDSPEKLATTKDDVNIRKMKKNWKLFCIKNKLSSRLWEWIRRVHRDGEVFMRVFNTPEVPTVRFIDPAYIISGDPDARFGIRFDETDSENALSIVYRSPVTGAETDISTTSIIMDKRNVDAIAPRGISSYWPILCNLRRLEKILVNSSVLATVQAAITMVRKHDSATGPKVQNFIRNTSDGINRNDSNGKTIYARKVRPGTVLDAPRGITYDFPSHNVDASSFIKIAEHELSHIAASFVLPVEWLLTTDPKEPLTPGSPVIANFEVEQEMLFEKTEELFWMVQALMGVNVAKCKKEYTLYFNGKRLAVGKALDEARVDQLQLLCGATSPQEIAAKNGTNWTISRANMMKHRATKQPGEVMPGDAGNTSPSNNLDNGGDGNSTTTAGAVTGQRVQAGDGGTNK